jgi:hypothetical protein
MSQSKKIYKFSDCKQYKYVITLPTYSYFFVALAINKIRAERILKSWCLKKHYVNENSLSHFSFISNSLLTPQEKISNELTFSRLKSEKRQRHLNIEMQYSRIALQKLYPGIL